MVNDVFRDAYDTPYMVNMLFPTCLKYLDVLVNSCHLINKLFVE